MHFPIRLQVLDIQFGTMDSFMHLRLGDVVNVKGT